MTTPVLADPRRSGTSSGLGFPSSAPGEGSAVEMPVLFQLADLSQLKVLAPPARPKPQRNSSSKTSKILESESATTREAPGSSAAKSEATEPTSRNAAAGSTIAPDRSPPAPTTAAAPAADQPLLAAVEAATFPAPAPIPDSPTIRERTQLRERRRQAAAKGDWFQTQGKYIVVVFLIMLVGTIYVARRGDDSPPSPTADTSDLAGETSAPLSPSDSSIAAADEDPQLAAETSADQQSSDPPAITTVESPVESLVEASPAETVWNSPDQVVGPADASGMVDTPPQASLQAPLAVAPPDESGADESLFPWVNQDGPRVAARSRPDAASSSVPMPRPNPHYQGRPSTPGAAGVTPQTQQQPSDQYPVAPSPSMPADPAAPAVYPVTDPATYRDFPSPPRPAASGAAPASYENRVPPAPRTSGPRYERTGSGLY